MNRKLASSLLAISLAAALPSSAFAQDAAPPGSTDSPVKTHKVGPGGDGSNVVAPAPAPAAPAAPAPKKAEPAKTKTKSTAAKGIYLSPVTPVADSVHVHDKVLEECHLQTLLPKSIAERNSEIVLSDGKGASKLDLKIVDIHAPSGGWFSGPKWITVEGKLYEGKSVKGSFIAKETSMASATACGMLSKVITVLGGDIAYWLQNPTKNATLGSAR